MIGTALLAALKQAGGSKLVKFALSAAGESLLHHLEDRTGIKVDDPGFDQSAADYAMANMQEMHGFQLAMRKQSSEDFKTEVGDVQHARDNGMSGKMIVLACLLVCAAVFSVVGTLAVLLLTPIFKPGVTYPDASMILITAIVNFMLGGVLGALTNYLWGTTRGSENKNVTIREALKRGAPAAVQVDKSEHEPEREPEVIFTEELSDERPYR